MTKEAHRRCKRKKKRSIHHSESPLGLLLCYTLTDRYGDLDMIVRGWSKRESSAKLSRVIGDVAIQPR